MLSSTQTSPVCFTDVADTFNIPTCYMILFKHLDFHGNTWLIHTGKTNNTLLSDGWSLLGGPTDYKMLQLDQCVGFFFFIFKIKICVKNSSGTHWRVWHLAFELLMVFVFFRSQRAHLHNTMKFSPALCLHPAVSQAWWNLKVRPHFKFFLPKNLTQKTQRLFPNLKPHGWTPVSQVLSSLSRAGHHLNLNSLRCGWPTIHLLGHQACRNVTRWSLSQDAADSDMSESNHPHLSPITSTNWRGLF